MAQWEFVEWLLFWILETSSFNFQWDEGNRTKSASKHKITISEVEEVFRSGLALPLGIQISPPADEQRLGIVGKVLQIAFTMREGSVRAISARPASRKERETYEKILRKIKKRV